MLTNLVSNKCPKSEHHLNQLLKVEMYEEELAVCNELLANETNEKENDFAAKNKVLQEYKMIDAEQNLLYKGKVAKVV
jgi:hypothetical protein